MAIKGKIMIVDKSDELFEMANVSKKDTKQP